MGKTKIVIGLLVIALSVTAFTAPAIQAKTKNAVIWKMNSKKVTYRKSIAVSKYLGPKAGWENIIGYGKKMSKKISKKAKFYIIKDYAHPFSSFKKVSKKAFIKQVKSYDAKKFKQLGKTYYWGMACKITTKNGKVVKIKQVFQS
ncbi:MAG: hypothetical protein K6E58_03820 [Eubacterium sp.]|nr:hypothetical protein [Eubacterium sp.]